MMVDAIRKALETTAELTGLHLTLVATNDLLHRRGSHLIGQDQQSHRSQAACDIGFGPRCVAHCRWQVNRQLRGEPAAMVTRCWKGLREIAVPLRWHDQHLAVLYAGTWRQISRPAAASQLPAQWLQEWRRLPLWQDALLEQWGPFLTLVAQGLVQSLVPLLFERPVTDDRQTAMETWFQLHACLQVGLEDLADLLGRSVSRTGVIVREHYGEPFALVIRRRRMEQACHLLRSTTLPIAAIAPQVGFEDPAYFSRVFRAFYGVGPRRWRDLRGSTDQV